MAEIKNYICDLCKKKFIVPGAVQSDITIVNGEHSKCWGQVCLDCIKKAHELIQTLEK